MSTAHRRIGAVAALPPLFCVLVSCGLPSCARGPHRTSPSVFRPTSATETVQSEEPWSFAGASGRLVRTRGYRLFSTDTDPAAARNLPRFLEACLSRYTTELAELPRPTMKLDTFLMADRQQWTQLTRQLMGDEAATYLRIQRGGFASGGRAILWSIGRRDTFAIAAHEGWHQYTQRAFKGELPAWLEEGIAAYMEGLVFGDIDPGLPIPAPWANLERFDQLRSAMESGSLPPLATFLRSQPHQLIHESTESTLTWYAQSWALTLFLREAEDGLYRPALQRLLQDSAAGTVPAAVGSKLGRPALRPTGEEIFSTYFGDPSTLQTPFTRFARAVARGDRAAVARGESPI